MSDKTPPSPDDLRQLLERCDADLRAGRSADAIEALERLKESHGGRRSKELAAVHQRLAAAYQAVGERDRALGELDAAFQMDPGSIPTLRDLGALALDMGDLDRAQKLYRALLLQKIDPQAGLTKAEVYYILGDIEQRQGNNAKAISMLERAIESDPTMAKARALLARVKGL